MMVYMEFDRKADPKWTNAEYLVQFGLFVSQATVDVNKSLSKDKAP